MQEEVDRGLTLAAERDFPFFSTFAAPLLAQALVEQGDLVQGIGQLRSKVADHRASKAELLTPYFLSFVAEAEGRAGNIERGLDLIDQALSQVARTHERWHEADLYRIKGELCLQFEGDSPKSRAEKAEASFRTALEIATRQKARSWELRAATSLARLWQQQAKTTEAHHLLSEVYNWFTEGFDTKDLQEAKALLQELE
jgi:predicted ATPase